MWEVRRDLVLLKHKVLITVLSIIEGDKRSHFGQTLAI